MTSEGLLAALSVVSTHEAKLALVVDFAEQAYNEGFGFGHELGYDEGFANGIQGL